MTLGRSSSSTPSSCSPSSCGVERPPGADRLRWTRSRSTSLVLVADPGLSSAGRIAVLLLLGAWALTVDPRSVLLRGTAVSAIVLVGEGLLVGAHEMGLVAVYMASLVAVMTAFAGVVQTTSGDTEALHGGSMRRASRPPTWRGASVERLAQLLHDDALQRLLAARRSYSSSCSRPTTTPRCRRSRPAWPRPRGRCARSAHGGAQRRRARGGRRGRSRWRHVADAADRAGLETEVQIRGTLAAQDAEVVVPIVRELVTNVERHAGATRMTVTVTATAASLRSPSRTTDGGSRCAAAPRGGAGRPSWACRPTAAYRGPRREAPDRRPTRERVSREGVAGEGSGSPGSACSGRTS